MRRFAAVAALAVVAASVTSVTSAAPARAQQQPAATTYQPPVDAPLTDTFRPPATPYGPGNRGIDYATDEGQPVGASAAGRVVFAGQVGNGRHVVVLHGDGIRTSYSFLADVGVRRGQQINAGDIVGHASASGLHFGARVAPDVYLDPLVLLGQRPGTVHLVDDPDAGRPLSEAEERRHLSISLKGIANGVGTAGRWAIDRTTGRLVDVLHRQVDLIAVLASDIKSLALPPPIAYVLAYADWRESQRSCTPADTPIPAPPQERRIVVLVGGLGSSTGHAAVLDVDTKALGYDRVDTYQFSYRADGRDYGPSDTMGDIGAAGEVLRRQIERLHAEYPGVPIDVIAHSQGGLVARVAITSRDDPGVATLVTLGTPHRGTNVATARAGLGVSDVGQRLLTVAAIADIRGIDPTAKSIEQMAETSPFLSDLNRRAVPANTHVVSIAARDDPLVTTAHSRMDGASNVVVTPNGRSTLADHARLPGSPEARAEIARSLAGQRPTCHSLREAMDDAAAAWALNYLEDLVGATVTVGGILFDARGRHG